jgi:dienelactone hydrolase
MEETLMNVPEGFKPALYGAVAGAVALAIVGFSWGGWVTGGMAKEMAADQARLEVVAALVPICLQQSSQDPGIVETLALMKDAYFNERRDMVIKAGWATMPGSSDPNRNVARACMEELVAQF